MPDSRHPLLLTTHSELLDSAVRIAAAAGHELCVVDSVAAATARWATAPAVLVGADLLPALADRGVTRRHGVVVLCRDDASADMTVWRDAVRIGAEHVAVLPEAERWLVDHLADAVDGPRVCGAVVTVLPGRGGAGASTLAVLLARAFGESLLIDLDPLGGGLDARLELETAPGLRWPDLASVRGRVSPGALRGALPYLGDTALLSASSPVAIPVESLSAVIDAGTRSGRCTVIDGTRDLSPASRLAWSRSDLVLIVVPADAASIMAARALAESVTSAGCRALAVLRTGRDAVVDRFDVERILDIPVAGEWGHDRGLARGESPLAVPGRSIQQVAAAVRDLLTVPERPGGVAAPALSVSPTGRRRRRAS